MFSAAGYERAMDGLWTGYVQGVRANYCVHFRTCCLSLVECTSTPARACMMGEAGGVGQLVSRKLIFWCFLMFWPCRLVFVECTSAPPFFPSRQRNAFCRMHHIKYARHSKARVSALPYLSVTSVSNFPAAPSWRLRLHISSSAPPNMLV